MKVLALDACTVTASAAVLDGDAVLAECACGVRATHAEQLLPLVRDALTRAGVRLDELARIAVGIGPGSFTGVRIGLATAKGLAVATGLPLYGVTSLDALAASAWGVADGLLVTALDARRGEIFAAAWDVRDGARTPALAPCNAPATDVGARLATHHHGRRVWCVGDVSARDLAALTDSLGAPITRAPGVCSTPLARWIAHVALHGDALLDDGSMEPTYLRGSDAKLPGARA
jgi:tRNA threonylcarbamoyladenosine biosynthesis protein TsaB